MEMAHYGFVIDTLLIDGGGGGKVRNLEVAVDKRDNVGIQTKLLHYATLTSRFMNGSGRLH